MNAVFSIRRESSGSGSLSCDITEFESMPENRKKIAAGALNINVTEKLLKEDSTNETWQKDDIPNRFWFDDFQTNPPGTAAPRQSPAESYSMTEADIYYNL